MSAKKFTPGPWVQGGLQNKDRHWMRDIRAGNDGIAWCGAGDDATAHANARLIAASPDLLVALKAVISVADRKTAEFDLARAAITKAGGDA
jgi:hypothetical protein